MPSLPTSTDKWTGYARASPPRPDLSCDEAEACAMLLQCYQQVVRSTMVQSLTELISRISLKQAFKK